MLEDSAQRERALDITRSFIVQAPAGSGKTTLLTQRYIKLYQSNSVNHPEEIIAITFTRKAASEMRHRIMAALNQTENKNDSAPDPSCLRIMTIDAFCKFLSAQMPCESRLSHRTQIAENPNSFYVKAIQHVFSGEKLDAYSEECLECFLLYLDNDMTRVNTLLVNLLASRDQWLWHIPTLAQEESVKALENAWKSVGKQYTSHQRKFVGMLSHLLLLLITELKKIFDEAQEMDFIEVSLRALEALGDEESPTDLTLKLDYQIKHILVDEFQDTSVSQWRLLQKLTAGFEPNDGRTLFLVGDPMQSIYRFRKAEVGLFLEVQKKGIGQLKPELITLSTNFRSTASIIDWVNQSFPKIFPKKADIYLGAIPYSASTVPSLLWEENKIAELPASVFYYPVRADQSHDIILIIQSLNNSIEPVSLLENSSLQTIAVLVRSRGHLQGLIRVLEKEQINFTAAEIDTWNDHPLVMDLFSLTRALLHPGDRIAWLSILRAPWCGCDLHELAQLCENDHESTVWSLLQRYQNDSNSINKPTSSRINCFIKILSDALAQQGRVTLREWVENTWLALKGPACFGAYFSDVEHSFQEGLEIAEYFFDLLDDIEPYYYSEKIALLQEKLSARKNRHRVFKSNQLFHVELMTIHKAKGLEFDHVIVPYLDKITRQDASKLFLWEESINAQFEVELLIAPIPAKNTKDKLYDYLKQSENQRGYYELQRLFYVAATRAKKSLHLVFSTEIKTPSKNSFLHLLWEPLNLSEKFTLQGRALKSSTEPSFASGKLLRLPKEAFGEESQKAQVSSLSQEEKITALPLLTEYQRRHLGTILHEVLELLSQGCVLGEAYLKIKLSQLMGECDGYSVIQRCLDNIQSDPVAKWILSSHREAKSEYKLSTKDKQVVIDRTFVDENDRRWIIDYKITEEVSIEPYRRQLENYAKILREIDSRPIYLGLYFPLTKDWLHWEYVFILK